MSPWNAPSSSAASELASGAAALDPVLSLQRLRWFIRLRWVFVGAAAMLLLVDRILEPEFARPVQLAWAIFALCVVNFGWWGLNGVLQRRVRAGRQAPARVALLFAHAQIAFDLFVLTVLVRYTGGVESPLAIFYVFHMALGSLLLPAGHALVQGAWAVALYGATTLGELAGFVTPHHALLSVLAGVEAHQRVGYVCVVVGAVCCGVFGTLFLTGDISARLRERERQLQASNRALRQSQVAIRDLQARRARFMQTAAHRLKSPLATVQTLAGLIRDEIVRTDARATAERIVRCCDEGIAHVTELLTLGRVQDADPQRHRSSHANVGAIVTEQCEHFLTVARGREIALTLDVARDVELVASVDPRDLADCISNVIDNALKYTGAGGRVEVRVERVDAATPPPGGSWIVVRVDDDGMGFDTASLAGAAGNQPSAFDAYRRGNNALAAGIAGSGLGLAIVRVVVEQAGGVIEVESAPGAGTRFALKFPVGGGLQAGPAIRDTRATRADGACGVSGVAAQSAIGETRAPPSVPHEEMPYVRR